MQKNVPKYTPDVGAHGGRSGRRPRSATCPTRCATTAARCCGSPTSGPSSTTRRWCGPTVPTASTHLVLDLDPPEADAFAMAVRAAHLVRQALADVGLDGRGEDQRRQGRARVRPDRRPGAARGRGRRDPGHRGAGRAARSRHRHDRVHEGGPRRQGVRRLDPGRRGHRGRGLQPAGPAGRAGVVPGGLGRPRRRRAGRLHRAHRARARSATATRGPSRCRRRSG